MRHWPAADRGSKKTQGGRHPSTGKPTGGLRPRRKQKHSGVRRTGKPIRARRPNSSAAPRTTPDAVPSGAMYACPDCGKQFPSEAGMQTHQYNVHGSAPMIVGNLTRCTECGVLVRPKRMSEHRERMHGLR